MLVPGGTLSWEDDADDGDADADVDDDSEAAARRPAPARCIAASSALLTELRVVGAVDDEDDVDGA